jgi:hypothetical protein
MNSHVCNLGVPDTQCVITLSNSEKQIHDSHKMTVELMDKVCQLQRQPYPTSNIMMWA